MAARNGNARRTLVIVLVAVFLNGLYVDVQGPWAAASLQATVLLPFAMAVQGAQDVWSHSAYPEGTDVRNLTIFAAVVTIASSLFVAHHVATLPPTSREHWIPSIAFLVASAVLVIAQWLRWWVDRRADREAAA